MRKIIQKIKKIAQSKLKINPYLQKANILILTTLITWLYPEAVIEILLVKLFLIFVEWLVEWLLDHKGNLLDWRVRRKGHRVKGKKKSLALRIRHLLLGGKRRG